MRQFCFKLALALGKTVKQLLSEMDSEELSEWIAFDRDYHLPDSYWQASMIAHTVASCMAPRKGKPYKIQDFMPAMRLKPQSAEQIRQHLDSLLGIAF